MISFLETHPEIAILGVILCLFGSLMIARGLQIRFARIPHFVVAYRGWSNPALSVPLGGLYFIALGIAMFREDLPSWAEKPVMLLYAFSFLTSLLGFFIWFPPCLLPGWYRRARKAGVPRHDPYAMARFKRLSKAEQRKAKWPNNPEEPD